MNTGKNESFNSPAIFICLFLLFITWLLVVIVIVEYQKNLLNFAIDFKNTIFSHKSSHENELFRKKSFGSRIRLFDHPDFIKFKEFKFFQNLTFGIKDEPIPNQKHYGLCALLVANYGVIKREILQDFYIWDASVTLFNAGCFKTQNSATDVCKKQQNFLKNLEDVNSMTAVNLFLFLSLLDYYLIYHCFIEDPSKASCFLSSQNKIYIK